MTDTTAGKVRCDNDLLATGFVQTPVLVLQDHDLSAGAKLTYGALLWYLWRGGDYPGQVALSEEFGMGERSVRRYLSELENRGYLRHERTGLGQVNTYHILTPWADDPHRPNWPLRPAKSAAQTGQICRSLEQQDSKTNKSQQQQPPAKPRRKDPAPAATATAVVATPAKRKEEHGDGDTRERLQALGVTRATAGKLIKEHGCGLVARWTAYTEHRLAAGWLPQETPAAWLVSALRAGDWIIPSWFTTPAEEQAAAEAQAQEQAAQALARRQAEAEEQAAAAAQRRATEARLGIDPATADLWRQAVDLLAQRGEGSIALSSAYLLPVAGVEVAQITSPVEYFARMLADLARREEIRRALSEVMGRQLAGVEVIKSEL